MSRAAVLDASAQPALQELLPVLRRAADLDPDTLVRLRLGAGRATALVRLPIGVLAARTVALDHQQQGSTAVTTDAAVVAQQALDWIEGRSPDAPEARDALWRTGLPPERGWRRLDTVPDDVIRPLVRTGAQVLQDAAEREGVPGATPRAEVADALLDSVVLTVTGPGALPAEITLRMLSALLRMAFLPPGGAAHIDVAGRWIRVAAQYGSVYRERPGSGLTVL